MEIIKVSKNDEELIEQIAFWIHEEWGINEGESLDLNRAYVKSSLCENKIPQTFALMEDEKIIGTFQIGLSDCDAKQDIYPWLRNVFIEEKNRGKGYLNEIIKFLKNQMRVLNINEIYLFTEHKDLYEKYGFDFIEEFDTFIEGKRIQRLYRLINK